MNAQSESKSPVAFVLTVTVGNSSQQLEHVLQWEDAGLTKVECMQPQIAFFQPHKEPGKKNYHIVFPRHLTYVFIQ